MAKPKGPTPETCALVDARDQERCVRCGMQLAGQMFSRHHRQLRRHGDHSAANLILLCGSGTTGCHGWVHANPALSYEMGWLLKGWQTPEVEPVAYAAITGYIRYRIFADGSRLLAA